MKVCRICHESKEETAFNKAKTTKDKLDHRCKSCVSLYNKRRHLANPLVAVEKQLKKCYKLDLKSYLVMVEQQNNCCAICGNQESILVGKEIQRLSVDHCHETGQIRELLCNSCNNLLGRAKDSPDILLRAIAYLKKHSALT